jgi:hypothetical protein
LEHDGVAAHPDDTLQHFDREGGAWNAAFESGREHEARQRAWRRQNNAALWCFIGFVAGGLLVGAAVFEYCAREMESLLR